MNKKTEPLLKEQKLISNCINGHEKSQFELYELYCNEMAGVCRRFFKSQNDIDDVIQLSFIKVFKSLHQYSGKGRLGGWIRTIVVNTALNYIKSNKRFEIVASVEEIEIPAFTIDNDYFEKESLLHALDGLDMKQKAVFNLYCFEGYSHKEIADKLNISSTASRSTLHRARIQLKEKIEVLVN